MYRYYSRCKERSMRLVQTRQWCTLLSCQSCKSALTLSRWVVSFWPTGASAMNVQSGIVLFQFVWLMTKCLIWTFYHILWYSILSYSILFYRILFLLTVGPNQINRRCTFELPCLNILRYQQRFLIFCLLTPSIPFRREISEKTKPVHTSHATVEVECMILMHK